MPLPIEAIRERFEHALSRGSVVVSAPTGSGKSTAIPRWGEGRVLVVEPRRVACQSLSRRVAELEGVSLGHEVGFWVRDNRSASAETRILFVTPGIALRMLDEVGAYDVVILDELHERGLETDLLLALLRGRGTRLVAMSATLDAERVAEYLGAEHIRGESRAFDVEVRYAPDGVLLPEARDLAARVCGALESARSIPGDVLVFLPGKAEINAVSEALRRPDLHVVELHGGLSLDRQARAFERAPGNKRKVVLATNVAETSLTIDGIGVVIDTGLVRRTRFHRDRGFLTLTPIARDSAEQRTGRAGRTGPGVCVRLWSEAAQLEPITPPAVYRESLTPLVLAAAVAGTAARDLSFLDPLKDYALDAAEDELRALGALDVTGAVTSRGRSIFGLPLDAPLARLLVEAERTGALEDAIDLVAAIAINRPFFSGQKPEDPDDDLRRAGCDAVAAIRAVRIGEARRHGIVPFALEEARRSARRLRRAFDLPDRDPSDPSIDRRRLAETIIAADPRTVHVARRRKQQVAWSNGGTEIALARESAVAMREGSSAGSKIGDAARPDAILVLESRALGLGHRDTKVLATCAMPVPIAWLVGASLGRERLAGVALSRGRVVAQIERVYAKKVLQEREDVPRGPLAREAIRDLVLRGSLFREARDASLERVTCAALGASLALGVDPPPPYPEWLLLTLETLGVESGEDLALLSAADVTFPDVDAALRHVLDHEFPRKVSLGDATYRAEYDIPKRRVTLHMIKGQRKAPPSLDFLPRFQGFHITIEAGGTMHVLR